MAVCYVFRHRPCRTDHYFYVKLALYALLINENDFPVCNKTTKMFHTVYLISHALGLIVVPTDKVDEYKKVLVSYCENERMKPDIANFLKEKCWIKME